MKYEFHVGDYVENKYGKVGYITSITYGEEVNKEFFYNIDIAYYNEKSIVGTFHGTQSLLIDYFIRIGQYDFTKQNGIKPLNYTEQSLRKTSSGAILYNYMRKINELVEAVNRLEEKVDEMA